MKKREIAEREARQEKGLGVFPRHAIEHKQLKSYQKIQKKEISQIVYYNCRKKSYYSWKYTEPKKDQKLLSVSLNYESATEPNKQAMLELFLTLRKTSL